MIEGIRESAIETGLIQPEAFDAGVRDLHRTTESDGVFCYTFFKGVGKKKRDVSQAPADPPVRGWPQIPRAGRSSRRILPANARDASDPLSVFQ